MQVVGVDACKGGWIAIALEVPDGSAARSGQRGSRSDARQASAGQPGATFGAAEAVFGATLDAVRQQLPDAEAFAVDIPIGLPVDGVRQADVLAKRVLGARSSSLFLTPVRQALHEPTHAQASAVSKAHTGQGISQQAYGLRAKIFEAEAWVDAVDAGVWEVHPEVSFTELLGRPAGAPKRTWAGMRERLQTLEAAGIRLGDFAEAGSRAGVDDVLDAAVAAWSAARLVRGQAQSYPDPPEHDARTGRGVAIWA